MEGIVAKSLQGRYAPGTRWLKTRHTLTIDAELLAVYGPADRPARLAVQLPDGTRAVTTLLPPASRVVVCRAIAAGLSEERAGGFRLVRAPVVVEVAVGTTRQGTVRYVRLREDLV